MSEPKIMHCWPTSWIAAAVKAGFAQDMGDRWQFESDQMRDKLAIFAEELLKDEDETP